MKQPTNKELNQASLFVLLWLAVYIYACLTETMSLIFVATLYSAISLHISYCKEKVERRLRRYIKDAERRGYEALDKEED
jgi:asparagine N-glycosylation enzyme membrane subunit Stt3